MLVKEIRIINKRIAAFKSKVRPVSKGRVAGRINVERNREKRFSRKMRGIN
jgi:hypothetical protein